MPADVLTGGCLCGAVRWAGSAPPRDVLRRHCGMCRRWTGGGFATLVWFGDDALAWRGAPTVFRSSPIARRAHCGICGTPLYLKHDSRSDTAVPAGTLDNPRAVTPTHHYGVEGRLGRGRYRSRPAGRETREKW
jgi:hypothetical protein